MRQVKIGLMSKLNDTISLAFRYFLILNLLANFRHNGDEEKAKLGREDVGRPFHCPLNKSKANLI